MIILNPISKDKHLTSNLSGLVLIALTPFTRSINNSNKKAGISLPFGRTQWNQSRTNSKKTMGMQSANVTMMQAYMSH